jgi:hypothetical protein
MAKKILTQAQLDAEAKAAEEAAIAEEAGAVTPTATEPPIANPPVVEPEPVPTPTPEPPPAPVVVAEPSAEVEAMKAELAEKQARIDELTKRVRDEDGKRGGDLTALRTQTEKLGDQLRELMAENRELRNKPVVTPPAPAPEPDTLETEYPDVAKAMENRTKPIREVATRAEEAAKITQAEIKALREERFFDSVRRAVPALDSHNADSAFIEWCGGRNPGSPMTRQETFNLSRTQLNPQPAIELLTQWEELKTKKVEPVPPVAKPTVAKPTKEAQVEIPSSIAPPVKKDGPKLARLAELEHKLYQLGTATKDDRIELDRLYEAQDSGELT